ncbi:uncharacterized protein EV420DRAFT_1496285 [Desarmillaria tabescens]|uniref:Uncharacterized protein n=1 Tax=Armillaria tabescens TaxID=1929756 RepID=A0AA39NQ27_ARMTA|nr:uncharacterized protein EV420DRAFT_1496285 [Desarmillaria tabescens]KAK0469735.1 hypothetical protein EV420DRAFT_1496285 [Desarmillaria tabescens]
MDLENDIVADSEGEDEYFPLPSLGSPAPAKTIQRRALNDTVPILGLHEGDSSHISDYTSKPSSHVENISVFTSRPQTSSHPDTEIPSEPPKPQRPRPRPIYKMKQAQSISDISGGDSSFAASVLSIADRAKMRSRVPKPSESGSLSSKGPIASGISLGVIDISSDDDSDELNSLPKSKPKARKEKEVSKPQQVPHNASKSPQYSPSQPISPATKNANHPSFLFNDEDMRANYDHPSIATLIEPDTSPRDSSPLPSRRLRTIEDDDVYDQLDSDIPPSGFFASSSLGLDKAAEDHSHQGNIPSLSPPIPPTKGKAAKKGRKKKNEDEESKEKSRSKGKKTKEPEAGAAAKKTKGKGKEKEIFKSSEFVEDDSIQELEPFSIPEEPNIMLDQVDSSSGPSMTVEDPPVRSKPGRKRKEATNDEAGEKTGKTSRKKRKTEGGGKTGQSKAKAKTVILSDDEDTPEQLSASARLDLDDVVMEAEEPEKQTAPETGPAGTDGETAKECDKENIQPKPSRVEAEEKSTMHDSNTPRVKSSLTSRYSIAPRFKSTPMSELIRRVNSLPSSPFPVGRPGQSIPGTAYSPYLKSSKSTLSRIAPLHPNRRTPPPPLPPPPPPKKTKKEKEREEQWEEELIEEVGGMTEWVSMTDVERREMRRMRREREMGGWED